MRYNYDMKRGEITEKIILGLCDLTSATEIIFSRDSLWRKMQKLGGVPDRQAFLKSFYSLRRNDFCYITKSGEYQITEKGRSRLEKVRLWKAIKNQEWDGWWRLVIFDISENKKKFREALRWKLNKFGFYPLQKSVFVFPYDCKKEIAALADFFEVNDNIEYIVAKSLGKKEIEIKKIFNL